MLLMSADCLMLRQRIYETVVSVNANTLKQRTTIKNIQNSTLKSYMVMFVLSGINN